MTWFKVKSFYINYKPYFYDPNEFFGFNTAAPLPGSKITIIKIIIFYNHLQLLLSETATSIKLMVFSAKVHNSYNKDY